MIAAANDTEFGLMSYVSPRTSPRAPMIGLHRIGHGGGQRRRGLRRRRALRRRSRSRVWAARAATRVSTEYLATKNTLLPTA